MPCTANWNSLCSFTVTCTNEEACSYPHNPEEEERTITSVSERGGLEQRELGLDSPHFVVG